VPVDGFAGSGYGVQLQVSHTTDKQLTTIFAMPLTIHIGRQDGDVAPMMSTDGTTWTPLAPLFSGALPKGARAGFSRNSDGSIDVQTTVAGYFALLKETSPPPAPDGLTGHFSHGQLVLEWPRSTGASGPAISYQVTLTNHPLLAIPGQTTAAIGSIHHNFPSVYRVIATDAAGKASEPSKPLVVLPSKRPSKLPKIIPRWAFALFDWRRAGMFGTRPPAPRIVPDWYWRWEAWHAAPFHFRA
jgi:hypothetical protein